MEPITVETRSTTLVFDGYTLTINRTRNTGYQKKGTRSIPIGQISGIELKPAGKWSGAGHIRFVIGGTIERHYRTTQVFKTDVLKDDNAVPFSVSQQPAVEALKAAIEQSIAQQQAGGVQTVGPSLADELAKLQGLYQQGVLSPDEFAAAKARLLSQ